MHDQTHVIFHSCDIGDQNVYKESPKNPLAAALHCQYMAEEWFGDEFLLSNLAVANALVSLYGCKHEARSNNE